MPAAGLATDVSQQAADAGRRAEHFGFGDGFSQPAIAGANTGPRDGEGTLTRWRRWRDLALGEFVLGYRGRGRFECGPTRRPTRSARRRSWSCASSSRTSRAFRSYVRAQVAVRPRCGWVAPRSSAGGRTARSLVDQPGPPRYRPRTRTGRRSTSFRYGDDPRGLACPLGAHVRRSNPRDALGWEGRLDPAPPHAASRHELRAAAAERGR